MKILYVACCAVLGMIILSPTVALLVRLPESERFSELYVLGPWHMAESYPFNISGDETCRLYLGVSNHMGDLESYLVSVKFRNQTESLPNSADGLPSELDPLFEYRFALGRRGVWERNLSFSVGNISRSGNLSRVSSLIVEDDMVTVGKVTEWDVQNHGFLYQLFFELWRYDADASSYQYDNRFVGIWLNVTMPS